MTITSLPFVLFVLITVLIYYLMPIKKYQWVVIFVASCFFYIYNSLLYSFYICFTITTIYLASLKIHSIQVNTKKTIKEHKEDWSRDEKKAYKQKFETKTKTLLAVTLIANFGILFVLKYFNSLFDYFASVMHLNEGGHSA